MTFIKIFFFSISTNLPSTAYLKMMDIWLLFGLFKPFIDIILQTYIETLRVHPDEGKDDEELRGDILKTAWKNNEKVKMNELKYYLIFESEE